MKHKITFHDDNSRNLRTLIFIVLLFFMANISIAQSADTVSSKSLPLTWYVSIAGGTQMSGIKDEDFINSNIAPLIVVTAGKWFTPYLALQIGYKGSYFNSIADDIHHHYGYYYGEMIWSVNQLIKPSSALPKWRLNFHGGGGYFYNYLYQHSSICANLGLQNSFKIIKNLYASLDVAAIMGWDIYQGDEDILPGISIGVSYEF